MAFIKLAALAGLALLASAAPLERRAYQGDGTYYYQGGAAGSCGKVHSDSDKIIALSAAFPGGVAANCGKQVTVTYKGKSVKATVADTCPADQCTADSIDMSIGTISAIDPTYVNDGRIKISWSFS